LPVVFAKEGGTLRKKVRGLQVGVVVLMALVGLSATSNAAYADTSCPSGYICFWTSPNYTGSKRQMHIMAGCVNLVYPYDNSITSWKNNDNWNYRGWTSYNCSSAGGLARNLLFGQHEADLPAPYDNDFSSIFLIPT
jgi:hypothetical protein